MSKYPISEYSHTRKQSTAAALIRAQGEQLRETPAEYVARICGRSDADGHNKRTASGIPE